MLGDFGQLFMKKSDTHAKIPKGILEAFESELPKGYSYIDAGDGFCVLNVPSGTNIKGKLFIEDATEENLRKCKNFDDLMKYAINIQKPIILLPDENGYYYLDGNPFTFSQLLKAPLKGLDLVGGDLRYIPPKFEIPFHLLMTVDEKSEYVTMNRVPYNSLSYWKFVSEEKNGLVVSIIVKIDEPTMRVSITTDFSNAGSVSNVCRSIYLFNKFANGEVKFFNEYVNVNNEANLTPYDEETIEYWNQLSELEKVFNVHFVVGNGVYEGEVKKIRELYSSIVKRTPFRLDETITKLHGRGDYHTTEEVDDIEGKEMYFRYLLEEKSDIMGVELSYVGIKYIFGAKICEFEYDENSKKFEIEIRKAKEQQDIYTATLYFESKEILEDFLVKEDEMKEQFVNAELLPKVISV